MEERKREKMEISRALVCVVCSVFFAACFFGVKAHAKEREVHHEENGLALTATFSLQEDTQEDTQEITLRAGRDFALVLTVKAEEGFCGYVNVLMQNEGETHVLYQQKTEEIPPGGSVTCEMILPMNMMTAGLYLTLADEGGGEKLAMEIPVETINYGMYELVAVFDPEQEERMYQHFSFYGNELTTVSEAEVAHGAQAMDALEILVTQESVLVGLEEMVSQEAEPEAGLAEDAAQKHTQAAQAQQSLKEWVAGGKTLVVGASAEPGAEEEMLNFGLQEKEILQEVVLRVGNYETTRESILATNEEIRRQHGRDARTYYIGDSMIGDTPVNSLSDKAVSLPVALPKEEHWWNSDVSYEALWQERGEDIVRCYHVGKGNVLVFAVPITYRDSVPHPLVYYRMVELVIDNLTPAQLERQNNDMYVGGGDGLILLSYVQPRSNGISVFPYVVILLVYIVVLIPAVFLLLRHFEKAKYLWGALPLLSVAVMGVVYLTGAKTRITQPYCSYVEVTDYTQEAGKQSVYFSVSAPTNEGAQVTLRPGVMVRLAQTAFRAYDPGWMFDYVPDENTLRARDYRAAVCTLPEGTRVNVDTIRAFAKTNFYAWADAPEREGELSAVIMSADKVVAGVLRNTTDQAFRQVYLCSRDFAIRAGSIQPGEEILLQDCLQKVVEPDEDGWSPWGISWILYDIIEGGDYSEQNILDSVFYNYLQEDMGMTYIFALPQEQESEILGNAAKSPGSNGLSVYIWAAEAAGE